MSDPTPINSKSNELTWAGLQALTFFEGLAMIPRKDSDPTYLINKSEAIADLTTLLQQTASEAHWDGQINALGNMVAWVNMYRPDDEMLTTATRNAYEETVEKARGSE